MLPTYVKITVGLGIILILMLSVPPEVESKVRVVRQKPSTTAKPKSTAKPGASTTAKPGASTTAKPGGSTTVKPGVSTSAKPGASTSKKPGGSTAKPGASTTKKPGVATTKAPVDPGSGEVTVGPPLTYVTAIPVNDIPGFTYITQYSGSVYYISEDKANKEDALEACNNIQVPGFRFALAGLKRGLELEFVSDAMDASGISDEILISVVLTTDKDGKAVSVSTGIFGQYIEEAESSKRKKRENNLISYAHRNVRQAKGAKKADGKKTGGKAPAAGKPAADIGDVFVTVWETHYPWLSNWTDGSAPACVDTSKCAPTVCSVTTPACTAETQDCTVTNQGECTVVSSGNCGMVCENCQISKPECYVQEPKCQIVQDRTCTINPPKCSAETPKCIIERPECVSRQPPCNITINQSPNCTTPEQCLTPQGMDCKEITVPCADPNGCKVMECTPLAICIKPDYCRMEQVICPPVETFCPPEIIKCPPPQVTCEEPEITCEEPKIYCPPPTVVCTRPVVNCSSPTVNCPNVVTTCPNPDIDCPPPIIKCPPPQVVCTPPANPCPVDPGVPGVGLCPEICKDGECHCVKLKKNGNVFEHAPGKCDESLRFICEGGQIKVGGGRDGGGAPAGGKKPAPKDAGAKGKKPK